MTESKKIGGNRKGAGRPKSDPSTTIRKTVKNKWIESEGGLKAFHKMIDNYLRAKYYGI